MSSNQHSPSVFLAANPSRAQDMVKALEEAGFGVKVGQPAPGSRFTEDELIEIAKESDAMMTTGGFRITRKVLESSDRLLTIAKSGIGFDGIDVDAATELGVLVSNTPVVENYLAVAEGTVARILALATRLKEDDMRVRRGEWRGQQHTFMRGKTVGIIGLGRIGSHVARLLAPFDVKLLATNRHGSRDLAELLKVRLVDLNALLADSDFVTIHCPSTPETRKMIGLDQLRLMKKSAYLVNTARGAIVDEEALHTALTEGYIAGAALDVFEQEPLPNDSPLREPQLTDRVLLSSHSVGSTPEAGPAMSRVQLGNCIAALKGRMPEYVVNPEVLPRWRERMRRRGILAGSD